MSCVIPIGFMRNVINKWKQDRFITPKLQFITRGTADEPTFSALLLEEQSKFGPSYGHFIEHVEKEVAKLMDRS